MRIAKYHEYCGRCQYNYIILNSVSVKFNDLSKESYNVNEDRFKCKSCNNIILRHPAFILSLYKMDNKGYMFGVYNEIEDISLEALQLLIHIVQQITVPSYSVNCNIPNKNVLELIEELNRTGYIDYLISKESIFIKVHPLKLKLLSEEEVEEIIKEQSEAINDKRDYDSSYNENRITNLRSISNDLSKNDKKIIMETFNYSCALTGETNNVHLDHVIPVSWKKVGTTFSNMIPLNKKINSSKGNKNVFEWYENNKERLGLEDEKFNTMIEYMAQLNNMTTEEYKAYVYECEMSKGK